MRTQRMLLTSSRGNVTMIRLAKATDGLTPSTAAMATLDVSRAMFIRLGVTLTCATMAPAHPVRNAGN
ncbi:hypothetical protein FRC20_007044 [Serendipita sp. 405]|nr:hypothetical protein FRC20_007044 [Serendipita sp. 405]